MTERQNKPCGCADDEPCDQTQFDCEPAPLDIERAREVARTYAPVNSRELEAALTELATARERIAELEAAPAAWQRERDSLWLLPEVVSMVTALVEQIDGAKSGELDWPNDAGWFAIGSDFQVLLAHLTTALEESSTPLPETCPRCGSVSIRQCYTDEGCCHCNECEACWPDMNRSDVETHLDPEPSS